MVGGCAGGVFVGKEGDWGMRRGRVIQMTEEEWKWMPFSGMQYCVGVVVVDGVIRKNRYGVVGDKVGDVLFIWDEVEV